jgi:hypothetical protein
MSEPQSVESPDESVTDADLEVETSSEAAAVGGETGVDTESSGFAADDITDPRVKAALERIADSAGVDINAVPDVLNDVYRRLNAAMADPEGG